MRPVEKIIEKIGTQYDETCQTRVSTFKSENVEISIEFLDLDRVYHPGDKVRVKLDINAKNNPSPKKVTAALAYHIPAGLTVLGKVADGFFRNTIGLSKEQMIGISRNDLENGFHQVVKKEIDLRGQNKLGICEALVLELLVPANIPPTYSYSSANSKIGPIRWFVRVMSEEFLDQGLCELEEIVVAYPAPQQDIPLVEKIKKHKKAEMKLKLSKKNWVEGEEVQGVFCIRLLDAKLREKEINIDLMLWESVVGGEGNVVTIVSKKIALDASQPGAGWTEYPFILPIPVRRCPSFTLNNKFSTRWVVSGIVGDGLFAPSIGEDINVYLAPNQKGLTGQTGDTGKTSLSALPEARPVEPGPAEKHKDELVRIQKLHAEINKAKGKQKAAVKPVLLGGCLGVMACFVSLIPLVMIFPSASEENGSPWPGLIGMLIMLPVWIISSILIRRRTRQKAADQILQFENTLNTEVSELGRTDPAWVALIGGAAVLLDPAKVEQMLLRTGAKRI